MNTKLITALRTSANALENGVFEYNWHNPATCNCGIVACALMGKSAAQMKVMTKELLQFKCDSYTWKNIIAHHCPVTGMPENQIIKALMAAGLNQNDIVEMENLSNPEVVARAVKSQGNENAWFVAKELPRTAWQKFLMKKPNTVASDTYSFTNKSNAIAYMRAWADILTERGALDNPEAESKPTTHREQNVREG